MKKTRKFHAMRLWFSAAKNKTVILYWGHYSARVFQQQYVLNLFISGNLWKKLLTFHKTQCSNYFIVINDIEDAPKDTKTYGQYCPVEVNTIITINKLHCGFVYRRMSPKSCGITIIKLLISSIDDWTNWSFEN